MKTTFFLVAAFATVNVFAQEPQQLLPSLGSLIDWVPEECKSVSCSLVTGTSEEQHNDEGKPLGVRPRVRYLGHVQERTVSERDAAAASDPGR